MTSSEVMLTAFSRAADSRFNPQRDDWRRDPQKWAYERLGIHLWSRQAEILLALVAHPRVAVRSAHSIGKSFGSAVAIAWWLDTHPLKQARCVSTAPTYNQVKAILWNEINQLVEIPVPEGQQPLPGRVNQTEWWIGNYLAALGRKPNDYEPAAFQGLHALYLLVVLDEADGLPVDIWTAVETLATNRNARILAIGNPDDPQSMFRRNQSDQDMGDDNPGTYHTIKIAAADTPNFTGEPVPALVADSLVTTDWVADKEKRWGTDSPLFVSKVLAEYPVESEFTVIRITDLNACRHLESQPALRGMRKLGVDLGASEAGDESRVRLRVGHQLLGSWAKRTADPAVQADWIRDVALETGVTHLAFDNNGVGYGFDALLKERLPNVAIQPVNTARAAPENTKYVNLRAFLWWKMRLDLQNRETDLTNAEDLDLLAAELLIVRWHMVKGRIQVEEKDQIRKRLGRSTDLADAAMLSLWDGAISGEATVYSPADYQIPKGPGGRSTGMTAAMSAGRRGRW